MVNHAHCWGERGQRGGGGRGPERVGGPKGGVEATNFLLFSLSSGEVLVVSLSRNLLVEFWACFVSLDLKCACFSPLGYRVETPGGQQAAGVPTRQPKSENWHISTRGHFKVVGSRPERDLRGPRVDFRCFRCYLCCFLLLLLLFLLIFLVFCCCWWCFCCYSCFAAAFWFAGN